MKAVILKEPNKVETSDIPEPIPGYEEVLVRVKVATLCKTDLFRIEQEVPGVKLPLTLGHEVAGIVEELGENVEGLSVGQLVTLDPPVPCRQCRVCQAGLYHLCPNTRHIGSQIPGGMAEYITIDYRNVYPVPFGVTPAAASLTEPFAVCLEAISQANGVKGKTICVFGDGPFGNILCRLARRQKAEKILLFGRNQARMALVKDYEVLTFDTNELDIDDCIRSHTENYGADVIIDTTGTAQILNHAVDWLMPRGSLVLFTPPRAPCNIDLVKAHFREISIVGSCRSLSKFPEALEAIRDDVTRTEGLISHRLSVRDAHLGFEMMRNSDSTLIKAAIVFEV